MPRTVAEWIGRTDDQKIPGRVKDRIFARDNGVCHICKLAIKVPVETWDADHVVALVNGGKHAEANLAPAHKHCHVAKTAIDIKEKSKVAKVRKKHLGITRPKQTIKSPGFPKAEREHKPMLKSLPPRRLYQEAGE